MFKLPAHGVSSRRSSESTPPATHKALFSCSVGSAATKLNFGLAFKLIHYYVITMTHE